MDVKEKWVPEWKPKIPPPRQSEHLARTKGEFWGEWALWQSGKQFTAKKSGSDSALKETESYWEYVWKRTGDTLSLKFTDNTVHRQKVVEYNSQ
jgi:hypothetical protein